MSECTSMGMRRAALALHALGASDRRWLLERLDAGQRERLQPLLAELDALGVRFDPADIDALSVPPAEPEPVDWSSALPDEPAWIIAALQDRAGALAPAARRALHDAARRRMPVGPTPRPATPPTQGSAQPARHWFGRWRPWWR